MWRALFLAVGICLCILGAECLVVEKAIMADKSEAPVANALVDATVEVKKEVQPPEWAPWSFMGAGAVVLLYSFSIPRRVAG